MSLSHTLKDFHLPIPFIEDNLTIKNESSPQNLLFQNFELPENRYKLNLPPLAPYKYNDINPHPKTALEELRNNIIQTLQMSHFKWNEPVPQTQNNNTYYKFELPQTNFQEEGQINYINLPEYKFHSEREPLTSQQMKEIWNNRTFHVKSEMENLPHLWNISKWLLHSSKERTGFFKKTLAMCLRLFYAIPNVINPCSDRVIRVNLAESLTKPNFFNVFVNFLGFFLNLWDFFFGFKFRTLQENYETQAKENISKQAFWKMCLKQKIFKETYELSDTLRENTTENKKKSLQEKKNAEIRKKISDVDDKFMKYFEENLKNELNKEDFEDDEIECIKSSIQETKQDKLYEFIEILIKNQDYPQVLSSVLKKIKAINIFRRLSNEKLEKIEKEREKLSGKIEKEQPIYFLIGYKKKRLIAKLLAPIADSIEKDFRNTLENELKEQNLEEEVVLYQNYQFFSDEESHLLSEEIKEMRKYCLKPVNTFTIKYPLFASQYRKVKQNNYWVLIKEGEITIYSNFMFYKVVKALASYFIKLYSLMFKILKWIWEGSFGVKCFFLCTEFYSDYSIDQNGVVSKNSKKVRPILRSFLGVIHGIQKSRKSFEGAPDDRFFGKNFGRILNILFCVFVRFLFAGIFIVLIVHPIINILCIFGGLLAALTTLIWLVFVEVFLLTWKLLIYDYKSTLRHHSWAYYDKKLEFYEHSHLKLLRSYKWFTLLHLGFDFLINVIMQFFMVLIMMIFSPLISIFVFIFGIFLYVLKCMWDWFILNTIVRCFARVPSRNSTFAYRISGPGISRDFYNTLESKDLTLLLIAHIEKLELDELLKEGNLIIEYPQQYMNKQLNTLFHKFIDDNNIQNEYMKDSFKNISFLKSSLEFYTDERKKNLPTIRGGHHTIRFTNEELEKNELLVENLLKEFITEKNMDRYIWDLYDLRKGLYKRLTRKILEQLLCHEAIKPVEYIDHIERVKFAHKHTKFNDYVSKFIDDKNEIYQKKKKKRNTELLFSCSSCL